VTYRESAAALRRAIQQFREGKTSLDAFLDSVEQHLDRLS
jgi:hypothetical protein